MTTKDALYRQIDAIPSDELETTRRALEPLADPVLLALANAPIDEEPETDEEREAVAEGRAALARGDSFSLDEVRRELGL